MNSHENLKLVYTPKTTYEITINPDDKHQFFGSPRRLELFTKTSQQLFIHGLGDYGIQYRLYPELSEPKALNKECREKSSSGSRLHYHGTIYLKDDAAVGLFLLKSQYCLTRWADVQINDYREEYWTKYCVKQKDIMKVLCKKCSKLPYIIHDQLGEVQR